MNKNNTEFVKNKIKIAVAMSGGVDSSVCAYLLNMVLIYGHWYFNSVRIQNE